MKRTTLCLIALAVLLGLPLAAAAQATETPPRPMVYTTYFTCEPNEQWLADMIVETV